MIQEYFRHALDDDIETINCVILYFNGIIIKKNEKKS